MNKHDKDCLRRKREFPYLCTCGLTDKQVADASDRLAPPRKRVGDDASS